jgi:hypothetical protein
VGVGRHAATAGLLILLLGSLMLAVPAPRPVVLEVREMNPWWITAAVALELASGISYVVVFRLFFDRVAAPDARALAWTSMASGVLLPGGGVGGLAIGGSLMRLTGTPTRELCRCFELLSAAAPRSREISRHNAGLAISRLMRTSA